MPTPHPRATACLVSLKHLIAATLAVQAILVAAAPVPATPGTGATGGLNVLGTDYPRAFFFRGAEGPPAQPSTRYEAWADDFGRLMGIMGKCLDEEVLGREARNPAFFSRFKREHPNQVVLLHFNGNARDPRHRTGKYFAGHWIYRHATPITGEVAAEAGESVVRVGNTSDFEVNSGRYRNANDDLALFAVGPDGRHDWNHCEQVQLLSVDHKAGTIRVRRGCYGTRPLAFRAGAARVAAHAVEGPWGRNNHLLWFYNFTTNCPRDAEGKTAADRLVDDLAAWFGPGGMLEAFDGLEFDVMFNETHGDTDGDGIPDDGMSGGINHYGIGVVEFARQLRARLGEGRIIQGDGALGPGGRRSQRAFGILNGIESEGFPNLNDWNFDDWSGGLNRHAFWQANARPPAFSYINHKWTEPVPGKPGEHASPDVPLSRHRLSFAAAQFTDAALCYSFAPKREQGGRMGIWDELRCGADDRLGWLGSPEAPAAHLAVREAPDLLKGIGRPAGQAVLRHVAGPVHAAPATPAGSGITLTPTEAHATRLMFALRDLPADGPDLVVSVTLRGEPMRGYPREMARFVECELTGGALSLVRGQPEHAGMQIRGTSEGPITAESGARAQYQPRTVIKSRGLPGIAIHPPYKNGKGSVHWCREADIPPEAELRFFIGMSDKAPGRSDGVWFRVLAADLTGGGDPVFRQLFERSSSANEWIPCSVSLARFAGRRVRLKFVADCGPADNATTDQGYWGDVKIVRAGQPESAITSAATSMTWLNDREFTSTFYFRDIRSQSVDLAFAIDGPEAVTLAAVAVHAHPDAMVRVFQNGLVLANPSSRPYTFDLATLTPDRSYRRLRGTPNQDPSANDGRPAPTAITLGERDALFLVRTH